VPNLIFTLTLDLATTDHGVYAVSLRVRARDNWGLWGEYESFQIPAVANPLLGFPIAFEPSKGANTVNAQPAAVASAAALDLPFAQRVSYNHSQGIVAANGGRVL
jgi:hypothetical protein